MRRKMKLLGLFLAVALCATPVFAQEEGGGGVEFSGAFGAGLCVIGGALGIGKLASSALESMARQPEIAAKIQTAMLIAAAFIEGFTLFAVVVCLLQNPFAN